MSASFSPRPYCLDLQKALQENCKQDRPANGAVGLQVVYGKPFVEEEAKTAAQRIATALDKLPADISTRRRRLMVPLDGGPAIWML